MKKLLIIALLLLPCVAVGDARMYGGLLSATDPLLLSPNVPVLDATLESIIDARVDARLKQIVAALRENAKETKRTRCLRGDAYGLDAPPAGMEPIADWQRAGCLMLIETPGYCYYDCDPPTDNAVESGKIADAIERAMK